MCARARARHVYLWDWGVDGVGECVGVRVGVSVCKCAWQGDRETAGGEGQLRGAGDGTGKSRGC